MFGTSFWSEVFTAGYDWSHMLWFEFLPALCDWLQTLWYGKLTLLEYMPVFVVCLGAHVSLLRWWDTELPALLTRRVAASNRLSRLFCLSLLNRRAVLEHDAWSRKTWLIWLNSEFCYNSECKKLLAHMLSCVPCLSLHVGYFVALSAWLLSRTTETPMGLLGAVAMTFAVPGFSLRIIRP